MTENQKKVAIIVATIVIALILLLYSKKGGTTIVNQEQAPQYQVSIPSVDLPPRSSIPITIPGLPNFTPYQYSAVSPCMCNGAEITTANVSPVSLTFVTNEGSTGPTVYNYPAPQQQQTGLYGIWRG